MKWTQISPGDVTGKALSAPLTSSVIGEIEMDAFTTKFKNQLLIAAPSIYLFQLIFHSFSVNAPMRFIGIGVLSVLSFPVGLLIGYAVLGFQVKNPFTNEKHIDLFCKAAFYFFYFGPMFLMVLGLLQPPQEDMPINMLPAGFGIAYAAYKIKQKYGVIQEQES